MDGNIKSVAIYVSNVSSANLLVTLVRGQLAVGAGTRDCPEKQTKDPALSKVGSFDIKIVD